ncbi:potassium channel family protein [Alkalihalobacterium bogoriense]|uniref:potassium channel family protein n=1 Tax=Alkalihalobacterium bogoriense TaxID=246272 RepID=UPI0009FD3AD8
MKIRMFIMLFIFDIMKTVVKVKNLTIILVTILFITSSSFIVYWIEPETFQTPFLAFWYVMTTITTTGYGDYVPETILGKMYALILYIFGILLLGIVIGKMVEAVSLYRRLKEEGRLSYKGTGHYVIIGWTHKSQRTINELFLAKEHATIVLIDTLEKTPLERDRVVYIQGDATEREMLHKANILQCDAVLVFAPDTIDDPVSIDGRSLLIASTIERLATEKSREIYTIVEIVREKHTSNFKHAKVDEFVLSNEAFSDLMAKSALHKGSTKIFMQLLSREHGDNVWELKKSSKWSTYRDAYTDLQNRGANLISNRKDFGIIRRLDEKVPDDAKLYVICDEETYEKICAEI